MVPTHSSNPSPPRDFHIHHRPSSIPPPDQVPEFGARGDGRGASTNKTDLPETVVPQTSSGTDRLTPEMENNVREVKVLLLGQSGSGKSTLQTNLHIHLSPSTFNPSRSAYTPVIYLNIITALHALFIELDHQLSSPSIADENLIASFRGLREELKLDKIRVRLLPLMALESLLVAELMEGSLPVNPTTTQAKSKPFVRPGWQDRIAPAWKLARSASCALGKGSSRKENPSSDLARLCSKTLASSTFDIHKLWNHWITRFYVSKRVIPLDDTAPYFLDHIERIGRIGYCPTNGEFRSFYPSITFERQTDDILHARIQTLGVTETEFIVPFPRPQKHAWMTKVYDISGVRGQRRVWIPFFDDVSVILFLAPISAFDQYLPENPSVNRLADSLYLWASICSNKLLQHARLVLFLNKIDLLKKKLDDGVCVRKYITSFSNRPNDFLTASSYFRAQFERVQGVARRNRRRIFVHFTSMLDTKAMVTECTVSQVKEAISRKYASQVSMTLV